MKPPSAVRVGPLDYQVIADGDAVRAVGDELGKCSPDTATIILHPDQPPGVMRVTAMHESLHGVTSLAGIADELGPEDDEKLVNRLAPLVLALIRDNPDLVKFLRSGA